MNYGIGNVKGGGGSGTPSTIEITKSYTIGYADAQALIFGAMNSGIDEHTIVKIYAAASKQNSNGFASGSGSTSASITDTIKYGNAGITAIGGSIQFGAFSSTDNVNVVSFNDNGTIKYGISSKPTGTSTMNDENYGLTIQLFVKPFVTGSVANPSQVTASTKSSIKLLVWNTTTNAYETLEWADQAGTISGTNVYKNGAYVTFTIAKNYILCGILEAKIEPVSTAGWEFLTEEDIA